MNQWHTPLLQTECLYDEFCNALEQFRVWGKCWSWCDVFASIIKNVMECEIREHDTIQYIKRYNIVNEILYIMLEYNII